MGLHKTSGQAHVVLSGVEHYLGIFGTAEAHERYGPLVKQWVADASNRCGARRPSCRPF